MTDESATPTNGTEATYQVTADELPLIFSLDEATGHLTWNSRTVESFAGTGWNKERAFKTWNTRFAGKRAGSPSSDGYIRVSVKGQMLKAHRVVFALVNGAWPKGEIDHVNGDGKDNRPLNLREVTHIKNCQNQKLRSGSPNGVHGIYVDRRTGKYEVSITAGGTKKYIGSFQDLRDAKIARAAAERALGFHLNHGRKPA